MFKISDNWVLYNFFLALVAQAKSTNNVVAKMRNKYKTLPLWRCLFNMNISDKFERNIYSAIIFFFVLKNYI